MIIVIAHQKGGVGKSTLTFNLAYYLRQYKPTLIDLDIQNTITYTNTIRAHSKKTFNVQTVKTDDELKYLISNNMNQLLIIDTGGFDSSLNRLSIIAADLVITPVSGKLFDLLGLKKFANVLEELSVIKGDNITAKVLLNNISPALKRTDDLYTFINKSNCFAVMQSIIRQRADIVHALSKGLAVGEYNPKCKADEELKQLSHEISLLLQGV